MKTREMWQLFGLVFGVVMVAALALAVVPASADLYVLALSQVVTPTVAVSPTMTVTPTVTSTPTLTATPTTTPTVTPTVTSTPTVTPTATATLVPVCVPTLAQERLEHEWTKATATAYAEEVATVMAYATMNLELLEACFEGHRIRDRLETAEPCAWRVTAWAWLPFAASRY